MRKSIIAIFALVLILFAFSNLNAQSLYCADYAGTGIRDTIAVAGSTNAGSGWFLNAGYKEVWVEVYNGTQWFTAKIDYPLASIDKFAVNHYGADSTLSIVGYTSGSLSIGLPLCFEEYQGYNPYRWKVLSTTPVTSSWFIQFKGFKDKQSD